jgi:hypothetical protein
VLLVMHNFNKMGNINTEYELLTKEIYEVLLKSEGLTVDVKHNLEIQGKAFKHQIDIFWEYKIAGITHKVAIECKNYNKNVSVAKVRDFFGVLSDIGNINGILVSKIGFQKGAKKYAEYYGINLRELRKPTDIDWKGRVKTIHVDFKLISTKVEDLKFNLDEKWIRENIQFKGETEFEFTFEGMTTEFWIYDGKGNKTTTIYELENKLPHNWKTENNLIFIREFDDGYIINDKYGKMKINSIEFLYNVKSGESRPVIIDGTESAKAILKDAISGEIKFFNKDGTIK